MICSRNKDQKMGEFLEIEIMEDSLLPFGLSFRLMTSRVSVKFYEKAFDLTNKHYNDAVIMESKSQV